MNYIYTLSDPITNDIKYIGKTNNITRRFKRHICTFSLINEKTLKSKWILSLKEVGLLPIMEVLDNCDVDFIDELEIYWISQFKCWGFDLANMTDGGDGFKGDNKSQIRNEYSRFLIKMNNKNRKDIIQFDMDNNIVDYHLSIHDAERKTGFHRSHISGCCKNRRGFITCHGYYFRYVDNYFECIKSKKITYDIKIEMDRKILNIKENRYKPSIRNKPSIKTRRCKRVIEYSKSGDILNVYESTKILSLETGIAISLISRCCLVKKHSTAKNRIFRYENDKFDWCEYNIYLHKTNKAISKYTIDGEFIEKFISIKEAAKSINTNFAGISKCCKKKLNINGTNCVVKGYTWRFFEENNGENF